MTCLVLKLDGAPVADRQLGQGPLLLLHGGTAGTTCVCNTSLSSALIHDTVGANEGALTVPCLDVATTRAVGSLAAVAGVVLKPAVVKILAP